MAPGHRQRVNTVGSTNDEREQGSLVVKFIGSIIASVVDLKLDRYGLCDLIKQTCYQAGDDC